MKRGSAWLSEGAESLAKRFEEWQALPAADRAKARPPQFDVVVVGSGYGGAVAAQRLSAMAEARGRAGMQVCVLERGLEYKPGDFPDRFSDLVGHLRINGGGMLGAPTNPEGLMDWRLGGDVGALVANGLGGGSLINAGVCEPADDAVFTHQDWPEPWRGQVDRWQALYARARRQLGAQPWPEGRVDKQGVMARLAERLGASCAPVWLSIVPPGSAAPEQVTPATAACIECGDCFTGCNVGAKLTLGHTYLARAHAQGARLFTGATVHSVVPAKPGTDPDGPRWVVRWRLTDPMRLPGGKQLFEVHARHVVLAAGTFGSTEILMRSREAGLGVSGRLGDGFSANGDVLSAYYDTGLPVGASPDENTALPARRAGPTITTQLRWQTQGAAGEPARTHTLQDLGVPGALGWVFSEVLTCMMVPQRWTQWHLATERAGDPDRYRVDAQAIGRSLLTVGYVDDGARGRLEPGPGWATALRDGELSVRWKGVGDSEPFLRMDSQLKAATPEGAALLRNPLWQFMPEREYLGLGQTERRLLTVHPLGGCRMATNARDGVVDPWGRVFDCSSDLTDGGDPRAEHRRTLQAGQHDRSVHAGLYVVDGSVMPTALGINPLLTITAWAEGAIDQWAIDERWVGARPARRQVVPVLDWPPVPATRDKEDPTGIRFNECMSGPIGKPDVQNRRDTLRLLARFEEVKNLAEFLASDDKCVRMAGELSLFAPGTPIDGPAKSVQTLGATVRWFATEPSCLGQRLWRAFMNARINRIGADTLERQHRGLSVWEGLPTLIKGATHFGALRRLEYTFEPLKAPWLDLPEGTVLHGAKRVGYRLADCADPSSSNPWRQLTELTLRATLPDDTVRDVATLDFEEMTALDRYELPIRVTRQANAVAAMRDTLRLALYFGRVMFGLHMFSFRRAEYPAEVYGPRALKRLPPLAYPADDLRFKGLWVKHHPVDVAQDEAAPLTLRLTRLREGLHTQGLPVVLIHGFGSGGVQFTHEGIPQPMAPWLAKRGHDVWVVDLRTSIGLESARRQWSMDDIARQDIPALIRQVLALTGQPQVHVVAHCIGSAMFCMATLGGHLLEGGQTPPGNTLPVGGRSLVASAVLMQVGPQVRLPYASRARAYVAMRLRQIMGAAEAQSVASQDVGDAEALMDRIFGTYLYPEDQREHYRLVGARDKCTQEKDAPALGPIKALAKNTARVNANRSTAIFGQLFQYENMTPELLAVLPDLLGPCNLTTYEQTAQYAYEHRLTDQSGEDTYVSKERLQACFDKMPVTLIHGDCNRTFDIGTLERNRELFEQAGVPFKAYRIPGFGHLDCVVGQGADTAVFPLIDQHLRDAELAVAGVATAMQAAAAAATAAAAAAATTTAPAGASAAAAAAVLGAAAAVSSALTNNGFTHVQQGYAADVYLPRVGPWLGHASPSPHDEGAVTLRLGLRLDHLGRDLQGVATLLCDSNYAPQGAVVQHPMQAFGQGPGLRPGQHEQTLELDMPLAPGGAPGALRLLVAAVHADWPAGAAAFVQQVQARSLKLQNIADRTATSLRAAEGLLIDRDWLARQAVQRPDRMGLALGACRQRPLLVDRGLADLSMAHLSARLDTTDEAGRHAPIDAVILAGDQVYADSRVDSGHAGALRRTFFDAHQEAWSAPWQREVLRRRPVYMVVDDHEFRNDYNNDIAAGRPQEFGHASTAWHRYQIDAGPPVAQPGASWRPFTLCGFPFFLCDTRSERRDSPSVSREGAQIMERAQMDALKHWLATLHKSATDTSRPKVIVTGTPIAPWFARAQGDKGQALWGDGWQRFPDSVAELLHFIADQQIQKVLFLAGDYHLHADADLVLQAPGKSQVKVRSIVTGGLYCPYPFANATRDEWLDGNDAQGLRAGSTVWGYTLRPTQPGSGYTRLTLIDEPDPQAPWVLSDFVAVAPNP